MKIALYAGSLVKGGTERVLVTLAHNFIKQGHKVFIVTTFKCENEYEIDDSIVRIISGLTPEEESGNRLINILRRFSKLRRIFMEIEPDKVISFIGKNNFNALLTAGRMGIPVAVSVRADPNMEYPDKLSRMLANILYPKAYRVILQTKDSVSFFSKAVAKKVVILKNPVNPMFFDRKPLAYEDRDNTIIAVGRVDENKNHEMLIRAFLPIAREYPEYRLVILGDGEKRKELISLGCEFNEELKLFHGDNVDRISLPGLCNDVPSKVERAKIFVLCSDTEGVPNTILEAMAVGTAVVSTDCPCGGPRETISDGENGLLVPVRNVKELENRLRFLITNPEKMKEIASSGQNFSNNYREDVVSAEWISSL